MSAALRFSLLALALSSCTGEMSFDTSWVEEPTRFVDLERLEEAYPFGGGASTRYSYAYNSRTSRGAVRRHTDGSGARIDGFRTTVAGVLHSGPVKSPTTRRRVTLPPPAREAFFAESVDIWLSRADDSLPVRRAYITFGSSFTSSANGLYTNQVVARLLELDPHAAILSLPGLLSWDLLAKNPRLPPLTGERVARDLYTRLRNYIDREFGEQTETLRIGLIGFSGGGGLAINLLAEDARRSDQSGDALLFESGALAFSPVVSVPQVIANLDGGLAAYRQQFPELWPPKPISDPATFANFARRTVFPAAGDRSILGLELPKLPSLSAVNNFLKWQPSQQSAGMLRGALYAEFVDQSLGGVARWFERERDGYRFQWSADVDFGAERNVEHGVTTVSGRSYNAFLREYAYPLHLNDLKRRQEPLPKSFEQYVDQLPALRSVRAPLYMVIPLDDPIAGCPRGCEDQMTAVFAFAEKAPSVRVFAPKRGGHLGFMMDDEWLVELLTAFFVPPPADGGHQAIPLSGARTPR